ncbi:serine/threonine-protein kinase [Aquabacterium sp. OR-4]|uniref:serine/threonine-protein kinase n=1 Tax=Aquabacterium sp. OR-4 TaxID=2978127 RepID=UPI0021B36F2E|nr:serine/threonine-protein kinase [Aquabacterium sp. OR-4]MDT7836997.1 serine/threonine-protein kinase [Aquabacterium sp. OR-4]
MNLPPERWATLKAVFDATLELPAAAREPVIAAAALPPELLAELRSLLAHHDDATGGRVFMAASAAQQLMAPPSRIGQRLGSWEIVRSIGAGGMGEVFEARRADGQFDGRAAVKLLKRGMDSAAVLQRFAQERQALARMSHPHIARLLDAGASADGLPFFVLEHVDGRPIDQAVQGRPLEQRLQLFLQLADAVAHAHRNLLVHRDLKPGNVLVDTEGQVKLLDFGIAKALDPLAQGDGHTTVAGQRPFTPHYASPEQVRGEPVTTATDIYSLGVLLYQLLTGTRPTGRKASTPAEAARSVLEDAPTRPSRLSPDETPDPQWLLTRRRLEGDLDNILLKALEKDPARRYASVDALRSDVQAYLGGYPVSARAAGRLYLLGKFARRHRATVAASAAAVLALVGGLIAATWQAGEARLARDAARQQLAGVKDIATELVFRYGDAIQQLPGGAKTQEALLKQTVASLDLTLARAPQDVALNALVASALGRLAQIQGNPSFAGPERAAEAQATVARALALAEVAWADRKGDARFANQHLITLLTQANMRRNAGDPAGGVAVLQTAARRAAESLAMPLGAADRAGLLELRANVLTNLAHFHDHSGRPSLGRPQDALRYYAQAQGEFEALYGNAALVAAMAQATDPGSPPPEEWANHNIANARVGRALVYQRLDDYAAMKQEVQAALLRRQDNLRRNPHSAIWRQGLMYDSHYLALALLRLDENAAALAAARQAWDSVARRLREDPGNALWPSTQRSFAAAYARALDANGLAAEAAPAYQMALQRAHQQRADADQPRHRLALAWLQVQAARNQLALGQRDAARALLQPALADLAPLTGDAAVGRDALLAQAEGLALQGGSGGADARAEALAALAAAARTRPLAPEQLRLQQGLQAAPPLSPSRPPPPAARARGG